MSNKILYQKYHSKINQQRRIISKNNFTYKNIIECIEPYLRKKDKVLEIGCATGTLSFYMASIGLDIDGIELSKNAYKYANLNKKNLNVKNINFVNIAIENYIANKKYDLVTCFEVLEHLNNDSTVLKKINKMMKYQSTLAISVPSINAPLFKLGVLNDFDRKVGHLRRYSLNEIKKKLKDARFEVNREYKKEGILRNFLFTNTYFGWMIKFTRFNFINGIITFLDNVTLKLFGESQLILICTKK